MNVKAETHPCIQELLDHMRLVRDYSWHTLLAYRTDLGQFLSFLKRKGFLDLFPEQIEQDHVRDFILELRRDGLSDASIARKGSALRTLFRRLLRLKRISGDPMTSVYTPHPYHKPPEALSRDELRQFLGYGYGKGRGYGDDLWEARDQAIMEVLYGTGILVRELVNLNVEDFDLDGRRVSVLAQRPRTLTVGADVKAIIDHYLFLKHLHRGRYPLDQKVLFVNKFGQRFLSRSVNRIIEKRARLAGLKRSVNPQILRNSFARHALESGHSLKDVQRMMGHLSVQTTALHSIEGAE